MLNSLLSSLYQQVIAGKQKAVAAAVVMFIATFVAQHFGVHTSDGVQQLLTSVVLAVLAHVSAYFPANK